MTQVDFYILAELAASNRFQLACRIADKARKSGHRVMIHTESSNEARHVDRLLWVFNEQSFIPHGLAGEASPELNPILIGDIQGLTEEHDVLINLATEVPTFFSRFQRMIECVDNDEVARKASRERYRFYRDRGYPLKSHQIA